MSIHYMANRQCNYLEPHPAHLHGQVIERNSSWLEKTFACPGILPTDYVIMAEGVPVGTMPEEEDCTKLQARINTAAQLLDSWEHDAPDLVPEIWYSRMRTALGVKK